MPHKHHSVSDQARLEEKRGVGAGSCPGPPVPADLVVTVPPSRCADEEHLQGRHTAPCARTGPTTNATRSSTLGGRPGTHEHLAHILSVPSGHCPHEQKRWNLEISGVREGGVAASGEGGDPDSFLPTFQVATSKGRASSPRPGTGLRDARDENHQEQHGWGSVGPTRPVRPALTSDTPPRTAATRPEKQRHFQPTLVPKPIQCAGCWWPMHAAGPGPPAGSRAAEPGGDQRGTQGIDA